MSFLSILLKKNVVSGEVLSSAENEAETSGKSLDDILVSKGVSMSDILAAKGEFFDIPVRELKNEMVPFGVLKYISEKSAIYYKIVPLGIEEDVLNVGIVDPDNMEARDALQFISSKIEKPFKLFIISQSDFDFVIQGYRGLHGEVKSALTELDEGSLEKEGKEEILDIKGDIKGDKKVTATITEDAPVTKIVATILRYATEGNASDIHIEHVGDKVRVRFRVDGILHTSLILPVSVHDVVVARVKILANMKLDEKRKPQDGRFSAQIEGRKVDFRVSTFPAYYGEKVVMRILEPEKGVKFLSDTGLKPEHLDMVKRAIKRPYGIILISGPTGSGKSTTLYAMLQEVDREKLNVLSLEDPVEFNIQGVSQSQVKPEIGYTFASGLRTTLRQDPDVIMVGEIRDKETAALAVQAALTGHLVLSTIHTNNAVGVMPRLIDMGVDPYLIAPTLVLVMAQRLVPTLCPGAGEPIPVEGSIKMMIEKQFEDLPSAFREKIVIPENVYKASPVAGCPTGTRGRVGVYEVIEMNSELEDIILKNPNSSDIEKLVRQRGMLTIKEDAMLKAFNKIIPFEEVNNL